MYPFLISIPLALVVIAAYAICIEPFWFRTRRETVRGRRAKAPIRILHLSDIHFGHRVQWPKERALRKWSDLDFDLVVVTGDMIDEDWGIDSFIEAIRPFAAKAPVVAVPGNHDYLHYGPWAAYFNHVADKRLHDYPRLFERLSRAGVCLLRNSRVRFDAAGNSIEILGYDDPFTGRADARLDWSGKPTDLRIVLTHTPDGALFNEGYDIAFSGHTHGGQISFFGYSPLTKSRFRGWHGAGIVPVNGSWMNISRGIGTSSWTPIRFMCRPEAVLITIEPVSYN